MARTPATICLTLAVLLGSAGVSWSADFQKGVAAYESGDFATALREWTPLAEQGDAAAQFNQGVGIEATGRPWPREREARPFSTCALAFSESWTESR